MKIWGYLLIFFNVVAAGTFTYFATAVWNKRLEWQYALLKQELVNHGLPVSPSTAVPDDLDEGSVPFIYYYGLGHKVTAISKTRLKKTQPQGGDILGSKEADPVTSQEAEVKRVEKIVFGDLDQIKDSQEKRFRLMVLLLNLSKGSGRQGVYALLKDWPDPARPDTEREDRARSQASFLGRTPPQVLRLRALAAVGQVDAAMAMKLVPEEIAKRARLAQQALAKWVEGEIPNAAPDAWTPVNPPAAINDAAPPKNDVRDRLTAALTPLLTELKNDKAAPDPAKVKAAVDQVNGLLAGDNKIASKDAEFYIPYITAVAGNLLGTQQEVYAAKDKLVELMLAKASTESEKKSLIALADLMVPADLKLAADKALNEIKAARDAAFHKNMDTAALELLRTYFEEAEVQPSVAEKIPEELKAARDKIAATKDIRDPDEKRRNIAHLLYHLDAHVGASGERRDEWLKNFARPDKVEDYKLFFQKSADNREKWHQRVVAIVGLEAYIGTAEAQATQFAQLSADLRTEILDEQSVFHSLYQKIVERTVDLAVQRDERELEAAALLEEQKALENELTKQLLAKQDLENQLAQSTLNAKKALAKLDNKVDELFKLTKRLGEAQDEMFELEIKLRDVELGTKK